MFDNFNFMPFKDNTNISIIFEFSKFNLLILNWFRKWRRGVIGTLEGELGEVEKAGNDQINVRVLKTLLVSKIRLCVVFQKLFIPLQHQVL